MEEPQKPQVNLVQKPRLKPRVSASRNTDGMVRVVYSKINRKTLYEFPLHNLTPNPVYDRYRALGMLVIAGIQGLSALAILILTLVWSSGSPQFPFLLVIPGAIFFGMCMAFEEYFRRSFDIILFKDCQTGNGLILHRNLPDSETCETFVSTLKTAINEARKNTLETDEKN